jgi:hypothetical protein
VSIAAYLLANGKVIEKISTEEYRCFLRGLVRGYSGAGFPGDSIEEVPGIPLNYLAWLLASLFVSLLSCLFNRRLSCLLASVLALRKIVFAPK